MTCASTKGELDLSGNNSWPVQQSSTRHRMVGDYLTHLTSVFCRNSAAPLCKVCMSIDILDEPTGPGGLSADGTP